MGDGLLAIAAVLGALIYLYADALLPSQAIGDPLGPKVFPALVGIGLLASGLLLALETWRKRAPPGGAAPADPDARRHRVILVAMVAWTACYYAAFEPLGYLTATLVYLLGLLAYFNRGRHLANIAVAVGFTGIAYTIFTKFLGVAMPPGLIAF
jgi:putative tricarboxylic transport membrane protein